MLERCGSGAAASPVCGGIDDPGSAAVSVDAEADKQLTVSRRWRISTGNWVDRGRQAQFAVDYDVACRQCGECLHQTRQTIGPFSATFREESDAALSQPGGFLFCGEPPLGREVIDHSGEMLT